MNDAELHELVMAHLSGSESAKQRAQLDALLTADSDHVVRYIRHVREAALIKKTLASTRSKNSSEFLEAAIAEAAEPAQGLSKVYAPLRSRRLRDNRLLWGSAIAASLMVITFMALRAWNGQPNSDFAINMPNVVSGGNIGRDSDSGATAAEIVRKIDCVWEDQKWTVNATSKLVRGQTLRISQGVMEIEFRCGARVSVEGPARFTIAGPKSGLLHSGVLTAVVPERARGFSVKAPTTNVVDLGTSFNMRVREDGSTEIHVLEGEVVSQPLNQAGGLARRESTLYERESLLVRLDGDEPITNQALPRPLVESTGRGDRAIGWDESLAANLVLWLAADHDVERDEDNGVRRWGDRPYGGNARSESAWQLDSRNRPIWIANAIGGKPALRFDGDASFLVTDSLATSDEQTVFLVVRPSTWRGGIHPRGWEFNARQILNYNGPPNLAMQFIEGRRFQVWNFVGTESHMLKQDGDLTSDSLPSNEAIIIRYLYSPAKKYAELAISGKTPIREPVSELAAIDSPKYIGCHWGEYQHYEGDLAELLIFNEALSNDAIDQINRYLTVKYAE